MRQNLKKCLWLCAGIAVIAWFGVSRHYAEKERVSRIAKVEAARAVSVLPMGVENAWISYIDKRFSEEIQREDRNLKIRIKHIGAEPSYAYTSRNHPYRVDCNAHNLGISISFGDGEDGSVVNLTGDFSADFANEPKRGVSPYSIASRSLDMKLCQRIAAQLAALAGQSVQP